MRHRERGNSSSPETARHAFIEEIRKRWQLLTTDRALELDPTSAYAHLVLGFLGWPEERFDEAVSHARKAVQLAPGAADILNNASFILAPSGFPEEALILAQKSIALNPNHPAVLSWHSWKCVPSVGAY